MTRERVGSLFVRLRTLEIALREGSAMLYVMDLGHADVVRAVTLLQSRTTGGIGGAGSA